MLTTVRRVAFGGRAQCIRCINHINSSWLRAYSVGYAADLRNAMDNKVIGMLECAAPSPPHLMIPSLDATTLLYLGYSHGAKTHIDGGCVFVCVCVCVCNNQWVLFSLGLALK